MNIELKKDFEYFLECANKYHINFYHSHSKEELDNYINNYLNNNSVTNKYELLYMIRNIIKYMSMDKDSHTTVYIDNKRYLPIDLIFINGSLFINSVFDNKYNKSKILEINNIPIEKLINEFEPIVSYSNKEWFERSIEIEFRRIETLFTLPSIDYNTNVFNFLTDKGLLTIDINKDYPKVNINNDKYKIINDILIFKYRMCNEKNIPNIDEIDNLINENNIKCIAIDMRNNSGGNETILNPLINYLKDKDISIDVIVNKGVFSATRWNILDLINIGARVIGENIGTPINCFGSRNDAGKTPNYGINMIFSKWYIYYDNNIDEIKYIDSKEKLNSEMLTCQYLKLDKEILLTQDEYLNNIDPILEYYKNKNIVKYK